MTWAPLQVARDSNGIQESVDGSLMFETPMASDDSNIFKHYVFPSTNMVSNPLVNQPWLPLLKRHGSMVNRRSAMD